ncbi:MAG: HEAT repeat domain-containing protein, partial [Candidatus Sericytochromatia bacterium]|nr:HEAT repeat domain-containing protein [Candidatus Tanganyikabacteria bacterium]
EGLALLMASFNKFADRFCRDSIQKPAVLVLYQPLPPAKRLWAQSVGDTIVDPVAGGLTALALLAGLNLLHLSIGQIALGLLPVVGIWLAIALFIHRGYLDALAKALERRRLSALTLDFATPEAGQIARKLVESAHPEEVSFGLRMLRETEPSSVEVLAPDLLGHPSADVRREVAATIERHGIEGVGSALRVRLDVEENARVAGRVARALAASEPEAATELLVPLLSSPDLLLRSETIAGLLRHAGLEGALVAGEAFLRAVKSPDPALRTMAARVLREVADPCLHRPLLTLLDDPVLEVRRAAVAAAASMGSARIRFRVVQALSDATVSRTAVATIASWGDAAVLDLAVAAASRGDRLAQRGAVSALVRINSPLAMRTLEALIDSTDWEVLDLALDGLSRSNLEMSAPGHSALATCIRKQVTAGLAILRAIGAGVAVGAGQELVRSLEADLQGCRRRLFWALDSCNRGRSVRSAWKDYRAGIPDRRACALEIIENLLPRDIREQGLAVLEEGTGSPPVASGDHTIPGQVSDLEGFLCAVALSPEVPVGRWTRAHALHDMGRSGDAIFQAALVAACEAPELLWAETAVGALAAVDPAAADECGLRFTGHRYLGPLAAAIVASTGRARPWKSSAS